MFIILNITLKAICSEAEYSESFPSFHSNYCFSCICSLGVRVVLLVRDPRGTLQSRKHRDWCPGNPDCFEPRRLCTDLVADYSAAVRLTMKYPHRFRYVPTIYSFSLCDHVQISAAIYGVVVCFMIKYPHRLQICLTIRK